MTEQELYNEYRKSDCKSFTDFLINKITELKKTYRKQRNKRIDDLQKENAELKEKLKPENCLKLLAKEGYVKFTCENGNEHDQLNKAKEIIIKLKTLYFSPVVTKDDVKRQDEILEEAEQFIKQEE